MSDCIEVKLGNKRWAKVSEEDADILGLGSWVAHGSKSGHYACYRMTMGGMRVRVWMHNVVMESIIGRPLKKGELVDHINGDKLDNRRSNLRIANLAQNNANKPKRSGNSQAPSIREYLGTRNEKDGELILSLTKSSSI